MRLVQPDLIALPQHNFYAREAEQLFIFIQRPEADRDLGDQFIVYG